MKIAIFVDAYNLYQSDGDLGKNIDFHKLKNFIVYHLRRKRGGQENINVIEAIYYLNVRQGQDAVLGGFVRKLSFIGYTVRKKFSKIMTDNNRRIEKCNFDVEMAVDCMMLRDRIDAAVFIGGDGDFVYLYNILKTLGREVYVIASTTNTAQEVQETVGKNFISLAKIIDKIRREEIPLEEVETV